VNALESALPFQAGVYVICLITSLVCAGLLTRAFRRTRSNLLLWTALGFAFLALNNLLLFSDMVLFPDVSLWVFRQMAALAAIGVLLYGFIWDAQ
jgi:hypothetical protein